MNLEDDPLNKDPVAEQRRKMEAISNKTPIGGDPAGIPEVKASDVKYITPSDPMPWNPVPYMYLRENLRAWMHGLGMSRSEEGPVSMSAQNGLMFDLNSTEFAKALKGKYGAAFFGPGGVEWTDDQVAERLGDVAKRSHDVRGHYVQMAGGASNSRWWDNYRWSYKPQYGDDLDAFAMKPKPPKPDTDKTE